MTIQHMADVGGDLRHECRVRLVEYVPVVKLDGVTQHVDMKRFGPFVGGRTVALQEGSLLDRITSCRPIQSSREVEHGIASDRAANVDHTGDLPGTLRTRG